MIYVISSKEVYAAKRLNFESGITNYALKILDLDWLIDRNFKILIRPGDVLYIRNPYLRGSPKYLSYIIKLAKKFKAAGARVVDANITHGDLGRGKWQDYEKLKKAGLPIPVTKQLTINPPSSRLSSGLRRAGNLQLTPIALKSYPLPATRYPLIIKWIYGLKGKGTFLIQNASDLKKIPSYIPKKELMVQEFVKAKYEYKIITVGYKSLPVVLRFRILRSGFRPDFKNFFVIPTEPAGRAEESLKHLNLTDPRPNASGGQGSTSLRFGRDDSVVEAIKIAERASKTLGRELAKVDILEDHSGKLYILEVNRFPGLESFEKLTKYNVVRRFVKYLRI